MRRRLRGLLHCATACVCALLGACGPDTGPSNDRTRCRVQGKKTVRGTRLDPGRGCTTQEFAFCGYHILCAGDAERALRSPRGECWTVGHACGFPPLGWSDDDDCMSEVHEAPRCRDLE